MGKSRTDWYAERLGELGQGRGSWSGTCRGRTRARRLFVAQNMNAGLEGDKTFYLGEQRRVDARASKTSTWTFSRRPILRSKSRLATRRMRLWSPGGGSVCPKYGRFVPKTVGVHVLRESGRRLHAAPIEASLFRC